jgi:glycine betaine/choline ABC-type transport system substrate-binding protein
MRRLLAALAALMLLTFGVAACGSDDDKSDTGGGGATTAASSEAIKSDPANKGKSITIGSKNFAEQYILGEIYAQALQAAGFDVKKQLDLGSEQIAFKALRGGQIDAYPEYTGTALTSFFDVKTDDVPRDAMQAYNDVKADAAKDGIDALPPTPFQNTYAVSSTTATAEKLGNPKTLSELKGKEKGLKLSGFPECKQRTDCLLGLQDKYGLTGLEFVSSEGKAADLDKGQADVAMLFSTDGELATGKYHVFADDQKLFPPYNVTLLTREQAVKALGANGVAVIEKVQKPMTEKVMQELNSRVTLDKEKPEDVAKQYLQESGFLS